MNLNTSLWILLPGDHGTDGLEHVEADASAVVHLLVADGERGGAAEPPEELLGLGQAGPDGLEDVGLLFGPVGVAEDFLNVLGLADEDTAVEVECLEENSRLLLVERDLDVHDSTRWG